MGATGESLGVQGPKNQELQCPRTGEDDVSVQQEREVAFVPFVLFMSSTDWMMPTYPGDSESFFSQRNQMLIYPRNPQTYTKIMFRLLPRHL